MLLVACGSKPSPPTEMPKAEAKSGEAPAMPAEVVKFHDILSPRWHAEKGPQRMADTCGAIGELESGADALTKRGAPGTVDAARWALGTSELSKAVGALKTTCATPDEATFEPAFHRVHEGFHAVAELAGGHDEHEPGSSSHNEHEHH